MDVFVLWLYNVFWTTKLFQTKKTSNYKVIGRVELYNFATKFIFIRDHMKELWFFYKTYFVGAGDDITRTWKSFTSVGDIITYTYKDFLNFIFILKCIFWALKWSQMQKLSTTNFYFSLISTFWYKFVFTLMCHGKFIFKKYILYTHSHILICSHILIQQHVLTHILIYLCTLIYT
jgi:hypothetical protein